MPRTVLPLAQQYQLVDQTLAQRLHTVIPDAMREYGYEMWVILCSEYNEDPLYPTMIPCLCLTARRLSCLAFVCKDGQFSAYTFGRPDPLLDQLYLRGWDAPGTDPLQALAQLAQRTDPNRIGINTSPLSGICDGLSAQLEQRLRQALGTQLANRLEPAYPLACRWAESRTPEELARYQAAYQLTVSICREAFSRAVITPGITTTTQVEQWIAQEINRLGLRFWFAPHVDLQRPGLPGVGTTGMTILPGDLLHYDVGLQYLGLCTDSQRLGYVLRPGETQVPEELLAGLRDTNRFQDIAAQEHRAGRTGNQILHASLERARAEGLDAMLYCHPVGYWGHGAGTIVGLWDQQGGIGPAGDFPLHRSTTYALELNTQRPVASWGGQTVRFCGEETVAFLEDGQLSYLAGGRDEIWAI